MNGKGSKQRPRQVEHKTWADNYDRIFTPRPRDEAVVKVQPTPSSGASK